MPTSTASKDTAPKSGPPCRLFLSYGRRDASQLADKLHADLESLGYEVWKDRARIRAGDAWDRQIADALRDSDVVVALLSPHAVRYDSGQASEAQGDSVCLDEISFARFARPPIPVVPVMAVSCEPPFCIFRLDFVDLTDWQSSERFRQGVRRLLEGIQSARGGEVRFRSWQGDLQPYDFSAFLSSKRAGFFGREWLFREIDAWRQNDAAQQALLIAGAPGTGKSSIVAELAHQNRDGALLAYHCCRSDVPETLEPWRVVRNLAAMIAGRLAAYEARLAEESVREALGESRCRADPVGAFENGILNPLVGLEEDEGGRRYILIDALDEAGSEPAGQRTVLDLVASCLPQFPDWLGLIATTRNEPDVIERFPDSRVLELEALDVRNLDDVRRYVRSQLLDSQADSLSPADREALERAVEMLCSRSAGNFLYVRQALRGANAGQFGLDSINAAPGGLAALYRQYFERQYPGGRSFGVVRQVLEVIVASREPLTESQIAEPPGLNAASELPVVLRQLAAYLPGQPDESGTLRYSLYHKSFGEWLTGPEHRGGPFYIDARNGHDHLATVGWEEFCRDPETMSPYALAHLPHHLLAAERWDDLEALFTDVRFLEQKAQAGQVFQLVGQFKEALEGLPEGRPLERPLRLIAEVLRIDANFIHGHPRALFACLWNRCWWHDCPEAAHHYHASPDVGGDSGGQSMHALLETGRAQRRRSSRPRAWLRSLRPPPTPLGLAQSAVFRGHRGPVTSLALAPDGKRVASGSEDATWRVWDLESGEPLESVSAAAPITSIAFAAGGAVFSGHADGTIRIWTADGRPIDTPSQCHAGALAISPDGEIAVSGSPDATIRLWEMNSGAEVWSARAHDAKITVVEFSPDGEWLASGSMDGSVRIWGTRSGRARDLLQGHSGGIQGLAWWPDGRRLATASLDRTVRLWYVGGAMHASVLGGQQAAVRCVAVSPDGRRVVGGMSDGRVAVWDAVTNMPLATFHGHAAPVRSVAFDVRGSQALSASDDATIRVWAMEATGVRRVLRGHEESIRCLEFSPDGTRLATGSEDGAIWLWDAASGRDTARLLGHQGAVRALAFAPDGCILASGGRDNMLFLWDVDSARRLRVVPGNAGWIVAIAFSPDGQRVASASADGAAFVWDVSTATQVCAIVGTPANVRRLAFTFDGRKLCCVNVDGSRSAWETETGRPAPIDRLTPLPHGDDLSEEDRWEARVVGRRTLLYNVETDETLPWQPLELTSLRKRPGVDSWAGCEGKHLHLVRLETEDARPPAMPPRRPSC